MSRWIAGKPVLAESAREKVLFPEPAVPMTRTRWPTHRAATPMPLASQMGSIGARRVPVDLLQQEGHDDDVGLLLPSRLDEAVPFEHPDRRDVVLGGVRAQWAVRDL